jgi:hypothetical protein
MDFVEQSIKTYSGLSTETKPTAAAGNNIPNGSRFREFDSVTKTCKTYFYNVSDDIWYLSTEETQTVSGARPIVDLRSLEVSEQILIVLKKIEYHLSIASDTDLTNCNL